MPSPLPPRVGRYEIVDRLGAGGMGVVYLATDPLLGRTVAIKVLPAPDDDLRERFQREARSAAALRHNNVVTIYDIGEEDGKPFITMEFVDGESMAEMVQRRAPLSIDRRLQLMLELCAGLGYAHKNKIVHRDIKPGNLMVTTEGSLKVLDFGLARLTGDVTNANLTRAGSVLGTPHYMSPEQVEGKVADARSDIFAVGLVFYELLTYQKAYPGDTSHVVLHNIVHTDPIPIRDLLPTIDAELEAIVQQGLEKDPAKRYQNLESMAADLVKVRANLHAGANFETMIAPGGAAGRPKSARGADSTPARGSRHLANLDAIAKRRGAQVEAHLLVASQKFAQNELLDTIEACENAVLLDPDNQAAQELLAKAQAALDEQRLKEYLDEARACMSSGDLTKADALIEQSLKLKSDSAEAQELQRQLKAQRRDRERAAEQARSTQAAVERAQRNLDEGALDAAVRAAGEALAHDPANADALLIRTRATAAIEERNRERDLAAARAAEAKAAALARQQDEEDEERTHQQPAMSRRAAAVDLPVDDDKQTVQLSPQALAQTLAEAQSLGAARTATTPAPPAQPNAPATAASVPSRPGVIKPLWVGAAAVLLMAAAAAWLFTGRSTPAADAEPAAAATETAPPPPAEPAAESRPGSDYASLIETARQRYAALDLDGAISIALSIPEPAPERAQAMQLIATMRSDAAGRAAAERQAAEASPAVDQALLQQGAAKVEEASKLTEPVDTFRAVTTYNEAATLFRQAPVAAWSADRLVAEAQQQHANKQPAAAIDFALLALQQTPGHPPAVELLQTIKGAAATSAANAARRARSAGMTEANSTGFRDARSKEAAARALSDPTASKEAMRLYGAAAAAYAAASIDRPAVAPPVTAVTPPSPGSAPANVTSQPAAPPRPAAPPPPASPVATPAPGEIEGIISTSARLRNDADAVNYLTQQQARYPNNADLATALGSRQRARDARIAELLQRARGANDEKALEALDAALAMNPARADVRAERDRRAHAILQVQTEKIARELLKKFEAAYESRNLNQFMSVATYRSAGDLQSEFQANRSIRVAIDNITVNAISEGNAIVDCNMRITREPAARGQSVTDAREWQLKLASTTGTWRIVEATPKR